MWLCSVGDYQPTAQALEFKDEVIGKIDKALADLNLILEQDVEEFNRAVLNAGIQPVMTD
jgi:hypothetical protein